MSYKTEELLRHQMDRILQSWSFAAYDDAAIIRFAKRTVEQIRDTLDEVRLIEERGHLRLVKSDTWEDRSLIDD